MKEDRKLASVRDGSRLKSHAEPADWLWPTTEGFGPEVKKEKV